MGKFITFIFGAVIFISCKDSYKAGNSRSLLEIKIETSLDYETMFNFFDTSGSLELYKLPKKLEEKIIIGGDLKYLPLSNKAIYFRDPPAEAYHLKFSGNLFLEGVYNSQLSSNWINKIDQLDSMDLKRIEKRLQIFFQSAASGERIKKMPDSLIFLPNFKDSLFVYLNFSRD